MQFLRTDGQIIVDESGREVLLTGYGIGNWMNQEGFLFGSSEFGTDFRPFMRAEGMDRGRSIHQIIIETCGRTYADSFWGKFYRAYFNEADIRHLAEMGFNSVRLPLKAAAFLLEEEEIVFDEDTFLLLDELLDACEKYGIYVILDMHAAVTGQSAIGCDDGVDNQPHLYIDAEGWERTILLWEEFARRYKERPVVAGYELLNEPLVLPVHDRYLPDLSRFYKVCIERIRKIDSKHMIFLQGHRFASRADLFSPDMDPVCRNWVLTMHMYETLPDLGAIGYILAAREELGVPVWMGETGGSSSYMTVLYEMLRENHIGVNIWCHKAVHEADAATLCTYSVPDGMERIKAYASSGAAKPSYAEAKAVFDRYLENVCFENCVLHENRANAILRRGSVSIPATGYDMLPGQGKSFDGSWPYAAFCGYRREDPMHIVYEDGFTPYESERFAFAGGGRPPKYGDWTHLELMLHEDDFACYTIRRIEKDLRISIHAYSPKGGELAVTVRDRENRIEIPAGCGTAVFEAGIITAGDDTAVKIRCSRGTVALKNICLNLSGSCSE